MKVRALTHFDNLQKGQEADLPKTYAEGVIAKGLAEAIGATEEEKVADTHQNKMASEPANKSTRARRTTGGNE